MGHPLGKAPLSDGTGTTPTDLQRIIGSQYVSSGLLPNGGGQSYGTSGMAYRVDPGAAFMWNSFSAKLGMLVPFEATTVQTDPAPPTGTRTDTIYVDGEGGVRVAIGTTRIPSGVAIANWRVPSGITATTSATETINRNFAIPAGASIGRLAQWRQPGGGHVGPDKVIRHTQQFALPSDRLIRADLVTTLRSYTATPGTAEIEVSFEHESGPGSTRRMLAAHTRNWNTNSAMWTFYCSEGLWTIFIRTSNYSGGDFMFGNASDLLTELNLWDVGVAR